MPDPDPEIRGGEALPASIWSKIKGGRGPGPRARPLDPPLRVKVKKGSAASVKTTEQVV